MDKKEKLMLQMIFSEQKTLINAFFEKLDFEKTDKIVTAILSCKKNLFFSGIGKSGIIAKKIADTFSSIGIKAFYLSPIHALHGDLGRIGKQDLFIALSKSGYTAELVQLVPYIKNRGAKVLAFVCNQNTPLEHLADISIYLPLEKELCPFNLVPTISTTIQLIFGDLLAVAVMQEKKLKKESYALNHPAGSIGKKLVLRVEDLMKTKEKIPICYQEDMLIDVLPILSEKRCGAILIVDKNKNLLGIFTDGDFRRALQKDPYKALNLTMNQLMNKNPKSIAADVMAIDALKYMEKDPQKLIMVLPVLEKRKVVGIIHLHDILQEGLKS